MAPSSFLQSISAAAPPIEHTSLSLSSPLYLSNNGGSSSSIFSGPEDHQRDKHRHYTPLSQQQAAMSATALLQKAAQMGASASNTSLLRGLGLTVSSPSLSTPSATATAQDPNDSIAGIGLGLPSNNNGTSTSALIDPTMFGNKPTTLDLLGLGIGMGGAAGGASANGLSALLTSFGGGFNVNVATGTWESATERKPNPSPMR